MCDLDGSRFALDHEHLSRDFVQVQRNRVDNNGTDNQTACDQQPPTRCLAFRGHNLCNQTDERNHQQLENDHAIESPKLKKKVGHRIGFDRTIGQQQSGHEDVKNVDQNEHAGFSLKRQFAGEQIPPLKASGIVPSFPFLRASS